MTYETVAAVCQVTSLLLFVALFGAVLFYALAPSRRLQFDAAARQSLDLTPGKSQIQGDE